MRLTSADRSLELHELRGGDGTPLLLLHPLHASSAQWPQDGANSPLTHWPGPVHALDFAGHGRSDWLRGGGYCSEQFAGDADLALAQIGPAALLGAGVGAYVALLLAGARPDEVGAALLVAGDGLFGAGARPDFQVAVDPWAQLPLGDAPPRAPGAASPDPMACCLQSEVRPPDYARDFAKQSGPLLLAEAEGRELPAWWREVRATPKVRILGGDLSTQLAELAAMIHGAALAAAD